MTLFEKICGYAGMFLLVSEITDKRWLAALTAFLYGGCMPVLAVYGLAVPGIPMLFWCALQIKHGKHLSAAYLYIILYGLSSSLVLTGFGILGMGLVWIFHALIPGIKQGKVNKKCILRQVLSWLLLLVTYLAEIYSFFSQLFGTEQDFISHRTEIVLSARPFSETFFGSLLYDSHQHVQGCHTLLLVVILAAVITGCVQMFIRKNMSVKPFMQVIAFCLIWNLIFAFLSAVWSSNPGVALRSHFSFLGSFQLNRLLWIAPCLWYLAAACGLAVICNLYQTDSRYLLCLLPMLGLFGATALWALYSGEFKLNVQKLRNPDYEALSYRDYYAIGVMEQARTFLDAYTGKNVDEYRVVSLGIDPAAALYHGFYCLDGYSSNYSLEYKKEFREIISPELNKSPYLTQYYDDWGNRCYLFSAEIPGYFTIQKNSFYFQNYQINTDALYKMGGRYLLSAAWIINAEEQGLSLLNETPFETVDSYYRIFVYEISPYAPK
ncbi:MAG: DUF6044 family protein [Butyrivibrio sp.]|nr:DUF6044 family protein [Acetatifactor muris]MCM1559294.1 DUF6044 family protein [Butyrivibrio sp.]